MELFEPQAINRKILEPLALKAAPKTLEEFVGQKQLVGPDGPLRKAFEARVPLNAIFYGPPGSGKTALARLLAGNLNAHCVQVSCVTTGIPKIKEAIGEAEIRAHASGQPTLLVLDEIHHFNRTQQDVLLPYIETGVVTVIGITTENPFFYIHKALLSR